MNDNDNLPLVEALKAAVAALGPKPPAFEIWALEHFPRFDDKGQPMILKVAASELDTIWQSVTGAEFIVMCNELTLADMEVFSSRGTEGLAHLGLGIPIFNDEQLREHWVKMLDARPRHPLFSGLSLAYYLEQETKADG